MKVVRRRIEKVEMKQGVCALAAQDKAALLSLGNSNHPWELVTCKVPLAPNLGLTHLTSQMDSQQREQSPRPLDKGKARQSDSCIDQEPTETSPLLASRSYVIHPDDDTLETPRRS